MNSGKLGRFGLKGWLGAVLRILVTLLLLLSILVLGRCGLPPQSATPTPTPAAATALLQINVSPQGATVIVDGLRSGTTPTSMTLPPGQHTVRIEQDGYEPLVETVKLDAGSEAVLSGELAPLPSSPVPTATLIPTGVPGLDQPLPDLVVKHVQIELESGGGCDYTSTELGVRVWVENSGRADAGPFVIEVNGVQQPVPEGLASGQGISVWFTGYVHDGENRILVDVTSQVQEADEQNNTFSTRLPIPTLPPTCTPPPAEPPASSPTPLPPTSTAPPPAATPPSSPAAVTVRQGQVTIPTYPYASFLKQAWNQTFNMPYSVLERAAYDASNPAPANVTYDTFVVENDYLRLTFLPGMGGRLYEVLYKPTGHRVTYRNPVLKPSPWGPPEQGWWLAAGGFEWCLPVAEHGYEWGVPWRLSTNQDGRGVTVTLQDSEARDRIQAEIAVRLEAGAGHFTIQPRLKNPTDKPVQVKYWTNTMLAPGGQNAPSADLRFVLPDAITAVTVHSRGDDSLPGYNERMSWPVANGVDLSRLGNWTDDRSGYVEIHGGPATTFDDSVTIPAGGQMQWTETWYPVAGLGGLRYANGLVALNLTAGSGQAQLAVTTTRPWSGDLVLSLNNQERWRQGVSLRPGQPFSGVVPLGADIPQGGRLTLRLEVPDGGIAAEYSLEANLK